MEEPASCEAAREVYLLRVKLCNMCGRLTDDACCCVPCSCRDCETTRQSIEKHNGIY